MRTLEWIRTVALIGCAVAASAGHAVMYRWVDENGSLNYSDRPPIDVSKVRSLTVIDSPAPMTPQEKRTLEIINGQNAGSDAKGATSATPEAAREISGPMAEPYSRSFEPGNESVTPRPSARTSLPEAVRDPCLRSPDPRCIEKNRDAYVPYLGYAPGAARSAKAFEGSAIGASASEAGGVLGGSITGARSASAATRRPPAWNLRHSLKDAKDLK